MYIQEFMNYTHLLWHAYDDNNHRMSSSSHSSDVYVYVSICIYCLSWWPSLCIPRPMPYYTSSSSIFLSNYLSIYPYHTLVNIIWIWYDTCLCSSVYSYSTGLYTYSNRCHNTDVQSLTTTSSHISSYIPICCLLPFSHCSHSSLTMCLYCLLCLLLWSLILWPFGDDSFCIHLSIPYYILSTSTHLSNHLSIVLILVT